MNLYLPAKIMICGCEFLLYNPILFIPERLIVKRAGDWPQLSKQHSLDKYRILALVKMMDSGSIPAEHEKETLDELVQKMPDI